MELELQKELALKISVRSCSRAAFFMKRCRERPAFGWW